MKHKFKVSLLQYRLLHYRTGLFERLRSSCAEQDIDLLLVHGQPTPLESKRKDAGTLEWATPVRNHSVNIRSKDILWQPFPERSENSDLVIFMQENRLISNYPWLFGFGPKMTRIAYWGHGRNFQTTASSGLRERWKSLLINRVDWWFAYTDMTKRIVEDAGYPVDRITVLNNAIDNQGFAADLTSVLPEEVAALRLSIGCAVNTPLAIFCGSLYPEKRLDLLVDACKKVIEKRPDFKVVVIGDGPSKGLLESFETSGWLHCVGAKRGRDKAAWFKASQIYLNPGLVGLHVLDSFVAGTPMITTEDALHSPEVEYLKHGHNGLFTAGNSDAYAQTILELLESQETLSRLRENARASTELYTLDSMVHRFTQGIVECLKRPRLL